MGTDGNGNVQRIHLFRFLLIPVAPCRWFQESSSTPAALLALAMTGPL
jgi:hypothetical protein